MNFIVRMRYKLGDKPLYLSDLYRINHEIQKHFLKEEILGWITNLLANPKKFDNVFVKVLGFV